MYGHMSKKHKNEGFSLGYFTFQFCIKDENKSIVSYFVSSGKQESHCVEKLVHI